MDIKDINLKKKLFLKNFLLNLLVDYNGIFLKIKKNRIIINKNIIIFNPRIKSENVSSAGKIIKKILDETEKNVGINDINYSSKIFIKSYGTSKPNIVTSLKSNDSVSLSQIINKNVNFDQINSHLKAKKWIELESDSFFEKLNKKFKTLYSGYDEKNDFKNRLEDFYKSNQKELNDIMSATENNNMGNFSSANFLASPIHLVDKKNEIYHNPDDFEIDLNELVENKLFFAQTLAIFWNQEVYKHDIIEGQNILLPIQNYTVKDYFLGNTHKFDFHLRNTIDSIDTFYKNNPDLYSEENYEILKESIEKYIDNSFTKLIWTATKNYENSKDALEYKDILNFFDNFIQDISKK